MSAVNALLEAFSWLTRKGIRRFVLIPLAVNIVVYAGATWAFFHYLEVVINHYLPNGSWLEYLRIVVWPLLFVLFAVVVFYTFGLIANIIAAPFNGWLSAAVEQLETGSMPDSGMGVFKEAYVSIWQEIKKTFYFLAWLIPVILLSFIPVVNIAAPLIWFGYSAWVNYLQYMDYPMSNNGIRFHEQRSILKGKPLNTFGFGALATFLLMIPIVNLFAMPVVIIGATLHWTRNIRPRLMENLGESNSYK